MSGFSEISRWAEAEIERIELEDDIASYDDFFAGMEESFVNNNRLPLNEILDPFEFVRFQRNTEAIFNAKMKELRENV
jgi:hypothetical protein